MAGARRAVTRGSGGGTGSLSSGDTGGAPPSPAASAPPADTGGSPPSPPATPVQAFDGGSPYYALGVGDLTSDDLLVAAHWTGSREEVVLLDPTTGTATFAGVLGDLYMWGARLVYDDPTRMAYAVGQDRGGVNHIYSFSLATGASTSANVPNDGDGGIIEYFLCGVTSDRQVVTAYWNGSGEAVVLLDPATGSRMFVGILGDLNGWDGQPVYDDARRVLYATGRDTASKRHLYALSLATGQTSLLDWDPGDINGGPLLLSPADVTSDGRLIGAYWTGLVEELAVIDTMTGHLSPIGVLGDLFTWDALFVYGNRSHIGYAIGRDRTGTERFYSAPIIQ